MIKAALLWHILFVLLGLTTSNMHGGQSTHIDWYPRLAAYIQDRIGEWDQIKDERRVVLSELANVVKSSHESRQPIRLTFICTHNSRRSQLAQVWAAAAAIWFGLDDVETFSGGTESTAMNPRVVAALQRVGFKISSPEPDSTNPQYHVSCAEHRESSICYSKTYDEPPNPRECYCAVMTCSEADAACPTVAGAAIRLAIGYDDPKVADDTQQERDKYDERCAQIAREMLFVFSRAKQ